MLKKREFDSGHREPSNAATWISFLSTYNARVESCSVTSHAMANARVDPRTRWRIMPSVERGQPAAEQDLSGLS